MEMNSTKQLYQTETVEASGIGSSVRWWFEGSFENVERRSIMEMFQRIRAEIRDGMFFRKYGIAIAGALLFTLWSVALCVVTGSIVRRNTTAEVTTELTAQAERQVEAALQAYQEEQQRAYFLSGEASRQAAMAEDASWIAKVLYGMKDNSTEDLRTAVWCVLARVDNPGYPNSVREVCEQKGQWMGFGSDNPVLTRLKEIALEELAVWYEGERIVGQEFVYLYWTPTEITLRDNWQDGSGTHYWRHNG